MQEVSQFDYCLQLKQLLKSRQAQGRTGKKFNNLGALSTENNLIALRQLTLELKPEYTLEIGLAFGASCLTLAASHQNLGHQPAGQHVAIDPFQSTIWDDVGRLEIGKAGLTKYVDVREDFSYTALPQLLNEGKQFSLIYIDGSHLFEDVFIDFYYSNRLLTQDGLLLFDDSSDPHIRKVSTFIDSNFSSTFQKIDLSHLKTGLDKIKHVASSLVNKNQLTAYRKIGKTERSWDTRFRDF